MLNLFSNVSLNQPSSSGITEPEALATGVNSGEIDINGNSFTALLTAETSTVEMLEELKTLLSAEDFMTLEGMLAEGQTLPLAEIVAALRQQLSGSGMEQLAPQTLKLADVIPNLEVVTEEVSEAAHDVIEQTEALLTTEQAIVPIMIGQTIIPVSTPAVNKAAIMQVTNGKITQPMVTGQVAIPSTDNLDGDTTELPFNLGNSSANSDQQVPAKQSQLTEAIAAQIAQKTPINNLFRTTEAGLTAVNNAPIAPGLALQNAIQPVMQNQINALPIHTPMGEKGWDQAVGERMLWMVGRQIQGAEVRITPPQLGPIDIRISIQNDQANVTFAAQHGVVREALEASIPRLREMLSENNLQLVNVDVNQRNNGEQQRASHFSNQSSSDGQDGEGYEFEGGEEAESRVIVMQSDGLVDDFA